MKYRNLSSLTAITAIASLVVASPAIHAQQRTFNNNSSVGSGDSLWSNAANWAGGNIADSNAEGAALVQSPIVDDDFTVNYVQTLFSAPAIDVTGSNTLTVNTNNGVLDNGIKHLSGGGVKLSFSGAVVINNSLGGNTGIQIGNNAANNVEFASTSSLNLTSNLQLVSNGGVAFNGTLIGSGGTIMSNGIVGITYGAGADNTGYAGDIVLNSNNGITSNTTVAGGFLNSGRKVQVNGTGGTLSLNGAQGMAGNLVIGNNKSLTLEVNANQSNFGILNVNNGGLLAIDLTASVTELFFSDSSGFGWTGATISIAGFKEDTIRFGIDDTGLTTDQLATMDGGIYNLKSDGFLSIPEPSSYTLLLGATGLAMVLVRRRR
jgi:hypothetical protein